MLSLEKRRSEELSHRRRTLSIAPESKSRTSGMKLQRSRLNMRMKFLTLRTIWQIAIRLHRANRQHTCQVGCLALLHFTVMPDPKHAFLGAPFSLDLDYLYRLRGGLNLSRPIGTAVALM